MKKIAIFASGSGTNAENIIKTFSNTSKISVELILSNKKDAYVLERAQKYGIDTFVFSGKELRETDKVLQKLQEYEIDFIVFAGFLLMIPQHIINAFPQKIINIHPALLPKYGGKGMYGEHVHKAVIENKELESGITIHYVNEQYDEGAIIFQAKCPVCENETQATLAEKIHRLEYEHFPRIIEEVVLS